MPKLTTWNPNSTLSPRQGIRAMTLAESRRRDALYELLELRLAALDTLRHLRTVGIHDLGCGDLARFVPVEDQRHKAAA